MVFASIGILHVETVPEANIKTPEDALWWAAETITTVGYGDKFPVTSEGRMLGVLLMVSWRDSPLRATLSGAIFESRRLHPLA